MSEWDDMSILPWPSTTQIIRHFGLMADLERNSNPAAMRRGRLVTAACHLLAASEPLGEGWEARHEECQPYLDAYRKFLREHNFVLLEAEREYRHETLRFVSHPDQIGSLDGRSPVDLELKSGSMPLWCRLQTAGQVLAIGQPAMRRYALHLRADGSYNLIPHDDYRDLDRFRAMVETWWTVQDFRLETAL
jgi:hypothetical protein